ncbi:MAG: hypothetical protein R2754_08005 [Microthrixaceae bacterium]
MAAPEHIARKPASLVRSYTSVPRVPSTWTPDRAGELNGPQPWGDRLGTPGPDGGFALTLAERAVDALYLAEGEHREDVVAGLAAVAAKRAASYGRAPVVHDVGVAAEVFGFHAEAAEPELLEIRRTAFEGVANPHHYEARRALTDLVPEAALRRTPDAVASAHRSDWRSLLTLAD